MKERAQYIIENKEGVLRNLGDQLIKPTNDLALERLQHSQITEKKFEQEIQLQNLNDQENQKKNDMYHMV